LQVLFPDVERAEWLNKVQHNFCIFTLSVYQRITDKNRKWLAAEPLCILSIQSHF